MPGLIRKKNVTHFVEKNRSQFNVLNTPTARTCSRLSAASLKIQTADK